MANKSYKYAKRGTVHFIQVYEWLMSSDAWRSMKPGPRALYFELKRRFKGGNNGEIYLSHREAAEALNVGRDTIAGYYQTLIERGFIVVTRGHCLGPSGIGQSATYALTEERLNGNSATKDFMKWKPSAKTKSQ